MSTTTLSSREFNQDTSRAKKAAKFGPVFITDRGQPAHVLLSIDDYRKLTDAISLGQCAIRRPAWLLHTVFAIALLLWRFPRTGAQVLLLSPKLLAFADECDRAGVHHVHSHFAGLSSVCGMLVADMLGASFSFMVHILPELKCKEFRACAEKAARILVNSERNYRAVSLVFGGALRSKVTLLRSAFLLQFAQKRELETRTPVVDIIAVGRLVKKKGFDDLIRAIALLKNRGLCVGCRIYGAGPQRNRLNAMLSREGLENAILVGPVEHDMIPTLPRTARVFVMPCKHTEDPDAEDGLPAAITEALALGVPVISCDVGGITEIVIQGATGIIVPENSPSELAAAIERILFTPGLRAEMGRRALDRMSETYSREVAASILLDVMCGDRASLDKGR